jgi:hypothetical protein
MRWFSVKSPGVTPPSGIRVPKWKLSAAINDAGIVFAPAAIVGDEQRIFMLSTYDGGPAVIRNGHVYLPTEWLIKEFPDWVEVFQAIEPRAKIEMNQRNDKNA